MAVVCRGKLGLPVVVPNIVQFVVCEFELSTDDILPTKVYFVKQQIFQTTLQPLGLKAFICFSVTKTYF